MVVPGWWCRDGDGDGDGESFLVQQLLGLGLPDGRRLRHRYAVGIRHAYNSQPKTPVGCGADGNGCAEI